MSCLRTCLCHSLIHLFHFDCRASNFLDILQGLQGTHTHTHSRTVSGYYLIVVCFVKVGDEDEIREV